MDSWKRLSLRRPEFQLTFHLVCCERFMDQLTRIEEEYFADFAGKRRWQVVNAILTVMEPFLRHHMNLDFNDWEINLAAASGALSPELEEEKESPLMKEELSVLLDGEIYRLLKKMHEAGGASRAGDKGAQVRGLRNGTRSMAVVFRAALLKGFELISSLGRDGLVEWVKRWLEEHDEKRGAKFRERWSVLANHMVGFQEQNVKYIALYTESYHQLHLYHPPPDH